MKPRIEQKGRFRIERLEDRIAPAHVHLPASPGLDGGPSSADEQNPHFSGKLRLLSTSNPDGTPATNPSND